jgi:site-specific recombinase XerC
VPSFANVQPVHVATWIEAGARELAAPSVKQWLAAIRHLFDWLVTGQVVSVNPAGSVRGPRHVVTSGQTPVLDPAEARALLDSIDVSKHAGLRDRALIGLTVYSFARIGAALGMRRRRMTVTRADKGKQFRSLRPLPLPTNPILPRDLERRRRRQRGLLSSVHLGARATRLMPAA